MVLYIRSNPGDVAAAADTLRQLIERYPSGPFRTKALFWQGRLVHESGDPERARALFAQAVNESPYDYYAIRARLWLALGPEARDRIWLDPAGGKAVRAAYERGPAPTRLAGTSPYHVRLAASVGNGLYAAALAEIPRLRERFPGQRLEAIPLDALDRAGALAKIAVLLALRQDAMAATDVAVSPEDRVAIAAAAGHGVQDWPLSLGLLRGREEALELRNAVQRSPHFVASAYPSVFAAEIRQRAREGAVRPELVYGIIRQESLFNPSALSPAGALGLFQFIPTTFAALDGRWGLLARSGVASREAFLLSPTHSIALGVRWLRDELLRAQQGNIALAVMEHNAGGPSVREWSRGWERLGRRNDVEYMVETIRFAETHLFTRRVLADLAIADAVGLFNEEPSTR
jgi:soluble lytic murein transglycosylase